MKRKEIRLTIKDRVALEKFSTTGVHNVRLINRAKIILALDISGGRTAERHEAIAERLGISRQAVNNARNDFLEAKELADFLQRKKEKRRR